MQNLGPVATQWLALIMSKIIQSETISAMWKPANDMALLNHPILMYLSNYWNESSYIENQTR